MSIKRSIFIEWYSLDIFIFLIHIFNTLINISFIGHDKKKKGKCFYCLHFKSPLTVPFEITVHFTVHCKSSLAWNDQDCQNISKISLMKTFNFGLKHFFDMLLTYSWLYCMLLYHILYFFEWIFVKVIKWGNDLWMHFRQLAVVTQYTFSNITVRKFIFQFFSFFFSECLLLHYNWTVFSLQNA